MSCRFVRLWNLKIERGSSSETSATIYQSTRLYIPEDLNLYQRLKPRIFTCVPSVFFAAPDLAVTSLSYASPTHRTPLVFVCKGSHAMLNFVFFLRARTPQYWRANSRPSSSALQRVPHKEQSKGGIVATVLVYVSPERCSTRWGSPVF